MASTLIDFAYKNYKYPPRIIQKDRKGIIKHAQQRDSLQTK